MNPPALQVLVESTPSILGSYGPLLRQVEHVLASPHADIRVIAELIEKDVDLTARLLRYANSAFYGLASRLSTVSEAISLMGIQQVHDLLSASVVIERFAGLPAEFVSVETFWQHSLAVGICAKLIASDRGLPKPENFFAAGLLHDIGRLVLYEQLPVFSRQISELYRGRRILLRDAEKQVLGYDHQNIAEGLLRKWKYPSLLILAVGNHHQPAGAEAGRLGASVIHIADHLVNAMRIGTSGERYVPPLSSGAWGLVGLPPARIEEILRGVDEQFDSVQEVFRR